MAGLIYQSGHVPFCEVLGDEIPVPFETVFLGRPVEVIAFGAGRAPGVVATCRRGKKTGEVAAWLQVAYLRYLGHDPGRASPPPGWRLKSWDQP